MSYLDLCTSIPLPKLQSLSPFPPFPSNSSSPTTSTALRSPFSLPLLTAIFSHHHHRLPLCWCTGNRRSHSFRDSQFSGSEDFREQDDKLLSDESEFEQQSDVDDESFDVESMEREAKFAVKEFSDALSRQLTIEDDAAEQKETSTKRRKQKSCAKNIPDHLLPRVTIVGRPNVGKSALFNRLVGGNKAIVVDEPGVTRDRLYGRSFWGDYEFLVVDTGGVVTISKSHDDVMEEFAISTTIGMEGIPLASREAAVARMPSMIEKQATFAVEESSVIIFLVDGQAGLTAADVEIGDWLRKKFSHKCIILAVNKCESPRKGVMQVSEFWSIGFSPLPISAISGTGTGELLDLICSGLEKIEDCHDVEGEEDFIPAIAIVGRPNVGKSSILNALVGEDRAIVSPVSGTTRDAIDTGFTGPDGQKFRLIDTAGIRRRAAVASSGSTTEAISVNRAFRAIRRSDVVALVIEAMACITEQDYKIAERIEREGKGCLIVVNKWDTIPNKNQQTAAYYEQDVRDKLRLLSWAPIVYSTAIAGQSVDKIIVAAGMVEKERKRRLTTSTLNQLVQEAAAFKPPPRTRSGKRGRIYYCTQAAVKPPTFVFFVNDAKLFPETYCRYMEKQLRSGVGFAGTPVRLLWRSRRKMEKNDNFCRLNLIPSSPLHHLDNNHHQQHHSFGFNYSNKYAFRSYGRRSFRVNCQATTGMESGSKVSNFDLQLAAFVGKDRLSKVPTSNIRNFCIIAHIDHGKSTLADKLLQMTGTVESREMKDQFLDNMDLERERGITIKLQAARMRFVYENEPYCLNLIDTPGHVDFSYEVSRSLAACEGALLVVDASQGVEAQTLANVYLALENNLEIIPVLNKIDLPGAEPNRVSQEIEEVIGLDCSNAIYCSAKEGIGIAEILNAIVQRIPPPHDTNGRPLRALIFDSYYDAYRGVIVYFRVVDGTIKKGDRIIFMASGKDYFADEIGVLSPSQMQVEELRAGEVGYLSASIKSVADARVGDTITHYSRRAERSLPGYKEATPMVFCGLFPVDADQFPELRDALEKLQLNDAALKFEPETSSAMGFGFRCGFLGLLHMEIVQERLEREYNLTLITTAPSVVYRVNTINGDTVECSNPSLLPEPGKRSSIEEPFVKIEILTPKDYIGPLMELAQDRRGEFKEMKYLTENRASLIYELPLAEMIGDFFDQLKSKSKGYASMEYSFIGYRESELIKLDILITGDCVQPLATIVHKDKAYAVGRALTQKLKELIPRQMFKVPIQACIGSKVIASESLSAIRKDVLAKCYGGDITRKKKLLRKQAEGKKRMKAIGKVDVPQEAFMAVLKLEKEVL